MKFLGGGGGDRVGREKIVGTIKVGEEPFFEVVDKGDATLEIRFVYEPERALRLPKKLVTSLTQILKAYDGRRRHVLHDRVVRQIDIPGDYDRKARVLEAPD